MKRLPAHATGAIVVFLATLQAFFVAAYVGHERTIYFWDHAMYIGMARQFYAAFSESLAAGWAVFENSLAGSYNLLFALPSLAGFSWFGAARPVFIVTNFIVFFLAYECAAAFFLRRALNVKWGVALILSFGTASLMPPLWLPLLEGYPDNGAAACIACAAGIGINGPGRSGIILRGLAIGLVLGLAVLLRRHFVYPVFALLATFGCFAVRDCLRASRNRQRFLAEAALYFAAIGAGFIGIMALIAPDFVRDALTTDYGKLYLSYQRPARVFVRFILGGFGFALLLAAAAGLIFLARAGDIGRRSAIFVTLFAALWLIVWCAGPDQMGHHYILHALPLLVTTGLAGWFIRLSQKPSRGKYGLSGVVLLLLTANSAWALWFSPTGVWPNDNGTPGLLSAARPPVVREDYDEWMRLAQYVWRTTKADDRVMVAGSSFVFNQDILHSIYMDDPRMADMIFRMPKTPEIDHEEPAPFDIFAGADVYLVPTPAQYHLDPAGQRVITAAADQFPPPASYAGLFHEDDRVFRLADGVTVKVWRRTDWTPGQLFEALQKIRSDGPQDKNFMQDWAAEILPLRTRIRTNTDGVTFVDGLFGPAQRTMRLFFDRPLAAGDYRLGLSIAGDCPDPQLRLAVAAADGRRITAHDFAPVVVPSMLFQSFSVPEAPGGDRFLQLDIAVSPVALCHTDVLDLRMEKN